MKKLLKKFLEKRKLKNKIFDLEVGLKQFKRDYLKTDRPDKMIVKDAMISYNKQLNELKKRR